MNLDTPLVEYLIIGSHVLVWIALIILAVFGLPLQTITLLDPAGVLLLLPIVYLLGMLFDSAFQNILDPYRKNIRDRLFKYENYKDEFIALESPELYAAYEMRVRRVRVIGAAIFNWPLIGITTIIHIGLGNIYNAIFVLASSVALCLLSIYSWHGLYQRAYKFRKNSCDIIREKNRDKVTLPPKR